MKTSTSFIEKIFSPYALIALNIVIVLICEFLGGGTYMAETGFVHAIAVVFVGLIIIRIFSDYAFSDYILRGFLKIQLTFFLFLGFVHIYEYFAEHVFIMREDVVQLTVMASYFVWLISIFLALGFVFRIYYKKSPAVMALLWAIFALCIVGLIAPSVSDAVVAWFPLWFPKLILTGIVVVGILGIWALKKLAVIMPVFREYSYYAIPATIFLVLASFSEYYESVGVSHLIGASEFQGLYISHYTIYICLSLLLVGFGKLKKPKGIYEEM